MKVYIVFATGDENFAPETAVLGVYQNRSDAEDKMADLMGDIENHIKTEPCETDIDKNQKLWDDYLKNWPHKIGDEPIEKMWVQEYEVL